MKPHSSVFLKWASQEHDADAEELFKKWCANADAMLGPPREIELWEPRYDRPVSEPPIFDYETFVKNDIPSDLRLEILFPGDPVKKTSYRDFTIMGGLVLKYLRWCKRMMEADPARADFYEALCKELRIDYFTDQRSGDYVPYPDNPFAVWEYHYLDQDGDTKKICEALANGQDIFWDDVGPATEKYGHLAPPGYFKASIKMRVMSWEYEWLDDVAGKTKRLERWLDRKIDVFDDAPPEVVSAYSYLLPTGWEPVMASLDFLRECARKRNAGQSLEGWAMDLVADYEGRQPTTYNEFRRKFETFFRERYLHITKYGEAPNVDSTSQGSTDDLDPSQEQALSCYRTENSKQFLSALGVRLEAVDIEHSGRAIWPMHPSLSADNNQMRVKGYNAGLGLGLHSWPMREGRETVHRPMSGLSSVE